MFTEDLSAFFSPDGFAQTVLLAGVSVLGMFDNGNSLGNVGSMGMASTGPMLTLATADVPASPVGVSVVVSGTSYLVASHEPDGTGVSLLLLEVA